MHTLFLAALVPALAGDLTLDLPSPLFIDGAPTAWVEGANPGTRVLVLATVHGEGPGPCRPGVCADLLPGVQQIGSATADAAGNARITLGLPTALGRTGLHLQAVVVADGKKSDPMPTYTGWCPLGADRSGEVWEGEHLVGADFSCQNLTRARFSDCDLLEADFIGARLHGAQFSAGTDATRARFAGATITGAADMRGMLFLDTDFNHAMLAGAQLGDTVWHRSTARFAHFDRAHLDGTDFIDADLRGAVLDEAEGYGTVFQRTDLRGASMVGVDLDAPDFTDGRLRRTDLRGARLRDASLMRSHFTLVKAAGAKFVRPDFTESNLRGSDLSHATIIDANWMHAICPDGVAADAVGGTCAGHLAP
jgi:uncharacterized protein YjbI with pentapeptide repeats